MPSSRMHLRYIIAVAALLTAGSSAGYAQVMQAGTPGGRNGVRLGAPAASYIAARLNDAQLDSDRAVAHEYQGKRIAFTPAQPTENLDDAAQGYVLGVLETEVDGGETGLPPGRYTIFAKNVGGEWEAFAEAEGAVVQQSIAVTATDAKESDAPAKPRFETSEGGWCWTTGPYPAPTAWSRYDFRGYWHYSPTAWGRHQKLTVCW